MKSAILPLCIISAIISLASAQAQAPALAGAGAPISDTDRIYTGDQTSNTITVVKPSTNEVLGTISLGDVRLTDVIGPQYVQSVNSHGLGFSRDGKYIVSLSVTTNTVTVIRTLDNSIVSQTFVDRNPHEAFFTTDNRTIWVGTRGVNRIDIIDGIEGGIVGYIPSPGGPSKVLFSPDGRTAYVNHIRSATLSIIDVEERKVLHNLTGLADRFSSDMMISADGLSLWVSHKMVGKVSVIDVKNRKVINILDTGLETNHPNFAIINGTNHAFVTIAALNETKVYQQPDPQKPPTYFTTIKSTGVEPHGLWPSADNTRMYIVNEHSDTMDVVDLSTLRVIDTLNVGQESQALIYVSNAVPTGNGTQNLGRQGLGSRVENAIVPVVGRKNGSALITVRSTGGLEMFQLIGRDLKLNATYVASASCLTCNGTQIPLLTFNATAKMGDGCGGAPQVLGFFQFFGVYDINTTQIRQI
jgi:YVTN family beta-propeller protein